MGFIHNSTASDHIIQFPNDKPCAYIPFQEEMRMRAALPIAAQPPTIAIPLPVLVAAFCLIWSSAFAVSKLALADCPPLLLVCARCLLAGAIMLGAATLNGTPWRLARRDLVIFAMLGVANNALYLGLNSVGIVHGVSAGLSALIVSANPVLTALLAAFLLGIGGVAVVVGSRLSGGESPVGVAFVLGALGALVAGTIAFKRLAPSGGLWIGNGVQNLAGGLALAPFASAFESVGDVVPSWRLLTGFAFLVFFSAIVAYLLWFHLLTVSGATAASAYHFMMPPLGLLFGWLLLGERLELPDLIGVLPVGLGIWLVTHAATPTPERKRA
jgi:drug/metabolite transporter (DMT)-like permease